MTDAVKDRIRRINRLQEEERAFREAASLLLVEADRRVAESRPLIADLCPSYDGVFKTAFYEVDGATYGISRYGIAKITVIK